MKGKHPLQFFVSLLCFWDISVCLICKLNILTSHLHNDLLQKVIYFVINKRNNLEIYMFGVVGETHAHDSFELTWCDNIIDMLPCPIRTSCTCDVNMFNFHIKQTEISQKRSKKTKNCKGCYFVILRLLSKKTNLISVSKAH